MKRKIRLDKLLVKRQLAINLEEARDLISAKKISVNGIIRETPESQFDEDALIQTPKLKKYVSRGGEKLESALNAFEIHPVDFTCLDIGSSTGGFTDCLLQNGALRVYCVDVGYGILDWRLRQDPRVRVLERTNARHLTSSEIPELVDLIVIDASFISLNLLLEPLLKFCKSTIRFVALVKPQFQLPKRFVGEKGIVRDEILQKKAVDMVVEYAETIGLRLTDTMAAAIKGTKGNQEFFIYLTT